MSIAQEIADVALTLSEAERAELAHRLLLSLEPEDFDADSEAAWTAEIKARMAKVDKGEFSAANWRDVIARIRGSLPQR